MKERKGPFGVMVGGIVDSVVQTARRRAQDREPRALIYDASGRPRLLKQGEPGREELVETGARLIELTRPIPSAEDGADQVREAVADLFQHAAEAAAGGPAPAQVEVVLPEGAIYALRDHGWTLAVVAGRFALSSLMFFDLRMVIRDLAGIGQRATTT